MHSYKLALSHAPMSALLTNIVFSRKAWFEVVVAYGTPFKIPE